MAATVIIPARYLSTRFPAKMLVAQTGRPLVQHAVDQVRKCKRVREIIVATDDQRIIDGLKPYNTTCLMTRIDHQSGTDRLAEVARNLSDEIIVNVQGDEPEIEPEIVDALIDRMETSDDDMATVCTPFKSMDDVRNSNMVKVVRTESNHAIYFSRSMIPFDRDGTHMNPGTWKLHLGIYAYRREFLLEFSSWKPTLLEKTEKLEQLRAIEHGRSIYVLEIDRASHGIDTPEQYAEFVKRSGGSR